MKTFTTGQIAKICGFRSSRVAAKLIDNGELDGHLKPITWQRCSHRIVSLKSLLDFMQKRDIPLDGLAGEIDVQKLILSQQTAEFKRMIERARKRSGVLSGFKCLPNALLDIVRNLDPLDTLDGVSEDRRRVVIFKKLIEVMESHINLRGHIATSKKK